MATPAHLCLPVDLAVHLAGIPCHLTAFFQQLLLLSAELLTQHVLSHLGGGRGRRHSNDTTLGGRVSQHVGRVELSGDTCGQGGAEW